VIAHGDYCDQESYGYVVRYVDLTRDADTLCTFVNDVPQTGGGGNGGEVSILIVNYSFPHV